MIAPKIVKACHVQIGDWMVPNTGKHAIQVEEIESVPRTLAKNRIRFGFTGDAYCYAWSDEDVRILAVMPAFKKGKHP